MSRMLRSGKHSGMVRTVLEYLAEGHEITAMEAARLWGELNLRNKISVLRADGYEILSREEDSPRGGRYKVYYMSDRQRAELAGGAA